VLVQLVMAAINTAPSLTSKLLPSTLAGALPLACGFFCARSSAIFFHTALVDSFCALERYADLADASVPQARARTVDRSSSTTSV